MSCYMALLWICDAHKLKIYTTQPYITNCHKVLNKSENMYSSTIQAHLPEFELFTWHQWCQLSGINDHIHKGSGACLAGWWIIKETPQHGYVASSGLLTVTHAEAHVGVQVVSIIAVWFQPKLEQQIFVELTKSNFMKIHSVIFRLLCVNRRRMERHGKVKRCISAVFSCKCTSAYLTH
jgi:hypothetical protein